MNRPKIEIRTQVNEGIQDWEYKKNIRKKNSLSKEEFQKCNVHLTEKQNNLYKGIRNNILTVVHGPAGTSKTYTTCYAALALLADKKIEKPRRMASLFKSTNRGSVASCCGCTGMLSSQS